MHPVPGGEQPIDLVEHSPRLRYEAFSHFTTQINQATTTEQLGQALVRHVKFMLDAFLLRLLHVYEGSETRIEMARGGCVVHQLEERPADHTLAFRILEEQLLERGVPLQLEGNALREHPALADSLFDHPKVTRFFAFPLFISENHRVVLSVASKEQSLYGPTDFRLIRLIGELLSGKLAHFRLSAKVERRSRQLAEANEELLSLNEQIKAMNQILGQLVEQRTGQLRQANEELNTIFYRTSHDFRRPLMTLLGLLNLSEITAREMALAPAPENVQQGLDDSLQICGQGKGVVKELDAMLGKLSTLSLLKTTTARQEPVDFEQVVTRLRDKFASELDRYGVRFRIQVHPGPLFCGNVGTISVILENLLENAIHFRGETPEITLTIGPETSGMAVTPGISTRNGCCDSKGGDGGETEKSAPLVMQVSDNGEGIPLEWQDKVFDLYVRASERSKGNGLGLYVVRKSAESLKGTVTVRSECYQGSIFTVKLPYQ